VPQLFVGCCGWTEAQPRYVSHFPVIELQSTFYEPPAAPVARRWKSLAAPDFRFCMKAWQLITHTPASPTYRKLKNAVGDRERDFYGSFRPTEQVWLAWERTREIAAIVDAQVVVFQCAKSFLPTRENVRNLSTFFREIDRDGRILAWEPRGEDWPASLVRKLCGECNLIHCVDPLVCEPAFGDMLYWRLHGRGTYRYRYTDADLDEIRARYRVHESLPGPHYILFNNMHSREDARRFIDLCGGSRG